MREGIDHYVRASKLKILENASIKSIEEYSKFTENNKKCLAISAGKYCIPRDEKLWLSFLSFVKKVTLYESKDILLIRLTGF